MAMDDPRLAALVGVFENFNLAIQAVSQGKCRVPRIDLAPHIPHIGFAWKKEQVVVEFYLCDDTDEVLISYKAGSGPETVYKGKATDATAAGIWAAIKDFPCHHKD